MVIAQGLLKVPAEPRRRVELRGPGFPLPHTGHRTGPKMAVFFIQGKDLTAETSILPVALHAATLDGTQPPRPRLTRTNPYGSIPILQKSRNEIVGELRVTGQLAVFPTCEPLIRPDPEASIARGKQALTMKLMGRD